MAAQAMPPNAPATIIAGRIQKPSRSPAASATPPPKMAPRMNWPSAPIFQTLARNPIARPTPISTSGAAFTESSAQPLSEETGEITKV